MRRASLACLILTVLGSACFEDLGPSGDDEGADATGGSTSSDDADGTESGSSDGSEIDADGSELVETEDTADASTLDDSAEVTSDTGMTEGVFEPCAEGFTCPNGGECTFVAVGWFVFNICNPTGCSVPENCPPLPMGVEASCDGGMCVIQCTDDPGSCAPGMVCADGLCYFNVFYGPCAYAAQCPLGSVCTSDLTNSACTPQCDGPEECEGTGEPESLYECTGGHCEISCTDSSGCPDAMECVGTYCRYPGITP